jgi:hypothetical protein
VHTPDILILKNTSQLPRRREEIEGGIRRTIDLNRMWKKFGWSTRFNENENLFPSPLMQKLENPRVPPIHYSINQMELPTMVPGRNCTRCNCQDKGPLCPDWVFSHRHGRWARSSHIAWKTVPKHNKSDHLHKDWRDPLQVQNWKGTLLLQYLY